MSQEDDEISAEYTQGFYPRNHCAFKVYVACMIKVSSDDFETPCTQRSRWGVQSEN